MMSCVNISVIPDDEALRKHHHSEKRTRSSHPSVVSGDTVIRNNQQVGSIDRTLAILLPLSNTPPQVDISTCNYLRRKTRVDVVGRGKGGICSSLIISRLPALSPSKKTRAASLSGLVASDSKRDSASLRLLYGAMMYQKDCSEVACFATYLIFPDVFVFKRVLFPLGDKVTYIQRCTCPAGSQRKPGNRSIMDRFVFRALGRSVTEGGQEKDGTRPEPEKQKKQKPEREGNKREGDKREGDKGKRKGKSPRTEELISSIMQKMGFSHLLIILQTC